MRAAAAAVLLAACARGDAARPQPDAGAEGAAPIRDFASGTRLRARAFAWGDVEALRAFRDTTLGIDCAFDLPGAVPRCLPAKRALHREGVGPYADRLCAEPWAATDVAAEHAVVLPADACAASPVVHRAGPVETRSAWFRDGERCARATTTVTMQPLAEVVPAESFVAAHEENARREGPIDARALVADDGARLVVGGFDRARGEVVLPDDAADGLLRWLPARVAFRNAGAEPPPWCSTAATKIAASATCPLSAVLVLEGSCGRGVFHALGDPAPDCLPGSFAFVVGPPIAPAAFARATYADVGSGPVRRRSFDGVVLGALVDAASGEPCVVAPAADDVSRCLPAQSELVAYFADDACATPAFAHPLTGCESGALATLVRDGAKAYAVGAEVSSLFELRGGACAPFTPTVRSRTFEARELPPSRFARAREVDD